MEIKKKWEVKKKTGNGIRENGKTEGVREKEKKTGGE